MRRLVGLLVVGVLVVSGAVVAVASTSATRALAQTPKLSPVPPFFSLTPPRPQKRKQATVLPPAVSSYSCPVAATGSRCSATPCNVYVAPAPRGTFHLVPGSATCTGATNPNSRSLPIIAR